MRVVFTPVGGDPIEATVSGVKNTPEGGREVTVETDDGGVFTVDASLLSIANP